MNRNYIRSYKRELLVKKQLEKEGWFCVRSAGSRGIADVVAIRPHPKCAIAWHFEVKFIQIKVSKNIKKYQPIHIPIKTNIGYINVETWKFPVKIK